MHEPTGASVTVGVTGITGTFVTPGSSSVTGTLGIWGTSGSSFTVYHREQDRPEDKIITITNRDKLKKIKVKEEKVVPEWTEVNPSPVFEMALKIAKNSFYGILGIKVKGTNPPAVSGKIKKIK